MANATTLTVDDAAQTVPDLSFSLEENDNCQWRAVAVDDAGDGQWRGAWCSKREGAETQLSYLRRMASEECTYHD